MDINELISIINESSTLKNSNYVLRDYEQLLSKTLYNSNLIKVISGLRRSGKSFLLKRLYKQLVEGGTPRENILFLNFENDRLLTCTSVKELRHLFDVFKTLNKPNSPRFIFLDEIQNVTGWHSYIRTLYDAENVNIYISGSNGKLLSGEIATVLGGRVLEFQIQPFNFSELAQFRKINSDTSDPFEKDILRPQLQKCADQYFEYGGLPESLLLDDDIKTSYRKSLLEKIVVNDIIRRHSFNSPDDIINLYNFLERSLGGIISAVNLSKYTSISDVTVSKYLEYIAQTFLIYPLNKYNFQARECLKTQKKYYFVDALFCRNASLGARLENLVFVELLRKYDSKQIFFARDASGHEVDFVILDNQQKIVHAFQVCYEINDKNYSREVSSLELLKKYTPSVTSRTIIYSSHNCKVISKKDGINRLHVSEWLINGL